MGFKLISDVSSYQLETLDFMKKLKSKGVSGLMVKLTDGTDYLNPKAGKQVTNGFKAGMNSVGLYHYFHGNGKAEATYFLKWVKAFGMDNTTPLAIDVEEPTLPGNITSQINIFLKAVKNAGFKCRIIYGSASWFNSGRIKYAKLDDKNIWVASYGGNQPGVDNASAWQFTDNYKGMHVDASFDFNGTLTGARFAKKPAPDPAKNYVSKGKTFKVICDAVNLYENKHFSKQTQTAYKYTKGSVFGGKVFKYGDIYRIQLNNQDLFVSANKKYIKSV